MTKTSDFDVHFEGIGTIQKHQELGAEIKAQIAELEKAAKAYYTEGEGATTGPVNTTGTAYYFCHEQGKIELTGDEIIVTQCPSCGERHGMDFIAFCKIAGDDNFGLYDTRIHCNVCSAAYRASL